MLVFLAAVCLFSAASALAQAVSSAPATSPAKSPAYEVISIRLSKPNCEVMSFHSPPGRLTIQCYPLRRLLFGAYSIKLDVPMPGMPAWADSALFDVEAKADDETTEAMKNLSERELYDQTQLMLRTLLADRFRLRVHTEMREGPVYNLVIAKSGFKLRSTGVGGEPDGYYEWGDGLIKVRKGPIASLVWCLSNGLADRTVIDETGLTGKYDIDLKWTPDDQQGTPDAGPTLFTALEEQLGLKLVPAKGPVDVFVVDHVEKPTEN